MFDAPKRAVRIATRRVRSTRVAAEPNLRRRTNVQGDVWKRAEAKTRGARQAKPRKTRPDAQERVSSRMGEETLCGVGGGRGVCCRCIVVDHVVMRSVGEAFALEGWEASVHASNCVDRVTVHPRLERWGGKTDGMSMRRRLACLLAWWVHCSTDHVHPP